MCSRSRHARAHLAANHIMTTKHSQRLQVFDFSIIGWSGKPLWHSREPRLCHKGFLDHNAHFNSTMALVGYWTRVILVRGECFTYKPTKPPKNPPKYQESPQNVSIFFSSLFQVGNCNHGGRGVRQAVTGIQLTVTVFINLTETGNATGNGTGLIIHTVKSKLKKIQSDSRL